MSIIHRRSALGMALVFAFAAWASPLPVARVLGAGAQAVQGVLPENIAAQKQTLEQAFTDALTTLSKEPGGAALVKDVRALCIGSWCANKASVTSDLDFTIDHPDKKIAARLKEMVNKNIDEAMQGKGHKIRGTYSGDPACVDCFSGEAGESFIYEYAERNSIGGKNTYKPVVEDGAVRFEKTDVGDFWRGTGKPVPSRVNNVQTFVDESARIFEMYQTGKPIDDALAAAKYMNNIETIVKPGFSRTYGVPLPPSAQLDEVTKYQMRELLKIKGNPNLSAVEKADALKKIFGAADNAGLGRQLTGFIEKSKTYFTTTKEKMGLLEDVVRRGGIAGAKAPAEALTMAEKLWEATKTHPGTVAFAALDIALLAHHYGQHGADQAFYEQLALTGAMHGLPPAAMIAMLGSIEKEIVRAVGEAAVNAFVFDPLNDQVIRASYDSSNAFSLFTGDFSPFLGFSRETIACKYMGNRSIHGDPLASELEPLLVEDIDRYVSALPRSSRLMFGDIGAGDIRQRFLPYLRADLARSRAMWQAIGQRETNLYANATQLFPPTPALQVWVDGAPLGERSPRAFRYDAPVGKDLSIAIALTREFARQIDHQLPALGLMQKQWCAAGGDWAAYLRWEKAAVAEHAQFEMSPSAVHVGAAVKNAANWRVSTSLPVGTMNLSSGASTGEGGVFGGWAGSDSGRQQFATGEYRIAVTPLADAKNPVSIDVGLRLKGDNLLASVDESYAFSVTITPIPAAPSSPAPPKMEPPPAAPPGGRSILIAERHYPNGQLRSRTPYYPIVNPTTAKTCKESLLPTRLLTDEGILPNACRHGTETTWFQSGQKESERQFVDGQVVGVYTFWCEGDRLKSQFSYKADVPDGWSTYWTCDTGLVNERTEYRDGVKTVQEGFWPNGQKAIHCEYSGKDGTTRACINYDSNGKIIK